MADMTEKRSGSGCVGCWLWGALVAAVPLLLLAVGAVLVLLPRPTVDDGPQPGMVRVPAGRFVMGCAVSDPECGPDEEPRHEVYLDTFDIDVTEVTAGAYRACVAAGVCPEPDTRGGDSCNWGRPGIDRHPANCIDWSDAVAYCAWAGKRLPTEAEWEKAARGTDGRIYPWGDAPPDCTRAHMHGCAERWQTLEVGSLPAGASPYGALDMSGNVWEWVSDWYSPDFYSGSPPVAPRGPIAGSHRVRRGGGSDFPAPCQRSSFRRSDSHSLESLTFHIFDLGFRCAWSPEPARVTPASDSDRGGTLGPASPGSGG